MSSLVADVFTTADLHFGHKNILRLSNRPFDTIEEHDETLIANWNRVVTNPESIVWVVGDYALGDRAQGLGYLSRLNGRKMLIIGNHDKCFGGEGGTEAWKHVAEYQAAGFEVVLPWARIRLPSMSRDVGGRKVYLSHFPYDGDHTRVDRHAQARLRDEGAVLIHGHTHGDYALSRSRAGSLQVHVGVDAHDFTPVNLRDVALWVAEVERKNIKVPVGQSIPVPDLPGGVVGEV